MRWLALLAIAWAAEPVAVAAPPFSVWSTTLRPEPFELVGDRLLAWDRDRDGVVELDATTGHEVRFRAIARLGIHGVPRMWQPVPGGYLTVIAELIQIREHAGALSATWRVEGQWAGSWLVAGDTVIGATMREPAVVALGLIDGKPRWRTPIADAETVIFDGDQRTLVVTGQRYLKMPPGPHDVHRILGALDPATGAQRWSIELPYEPNELALGSGGFALATDTPELVLYDTAGHPTTLALRDRYPHLLVDAGVAYVVDRAERTIAAYRIGDGTQLWRITHEVGHATLVVRDRLLLVTTSYGTVLALDRATGALQWDIGTGFERPDLYVGDRTVVTVDGRRAVGFVRPDVAPAPELATIRGRVTRFACHDAAHPTIRVGAQEVAIANDGRFTAQVRAVGIVRVAGDSDDEALRSSFAVPLTGAGDYTIPDLELGHCDRE